MTANPNPVGLEGIDFIEFSTKSPDWMRKLFYEFGFSKRLEHATKKIEYFNQNDIHIFLNSEKDSFASSFEKLHGPCVSSMGWRVKNAKAAFDKAVELGAKPAKNLDYARTEGGNLYAIYGIGDSLIYFIENGKDKNRYKNLGFVEKEVVTHKEKGFLCVDHLTNNVPQGTMTEWSNFYKNIFGFTEIRYFDIRGIKTGLLSYALQSPCKTFCIPINEGTESKSQINEYLEEYKGPGVQHIAFLTVDIVSSLNSLQGSSIQTLDIDDEYYAEVFDRVPNVTEDHKTLQKLKILADGDEQGYLLQIFTKNLIGPIFIEIIQRKNHHAFGEGNFGALFRSIERDQQKRGYLK